MMTYAACEPFGLVEGLEPSPVGPNAVGAT